MILMGRVGAPHGLKGFSRIQCYGSSPEQFLAYSPWYLQHRAIFNEIHVAEYNLETNKFWVRFTGVEDRTQAALLTNQSIYITRDQLPPLASDEYYWSDLEGLRVQHIDGRSLGRVKYLFNNGASDILVVGEGTIENAQDILIPLVIGHGVVKIDLSNQLILVTWQEQE